MAWFIIQCERKTWTKFLVEAKDKNAAFEESDNLQYLGHLDGEDTDSTVAGGPFESKADTLADVLSFVEG